MRKKIIAGLLVVMFAMTGTACGEKSFDNENAYVSNTSKSGETATEQGEATDQQVLANSYEFSFGEKVIAPDMEFNEDSFGKAKDYFEAPSCAFEGLDKIFSYEHFEIHTYPKNDQDYISMIWLMDDLVSTKEGIAVGNTLEEVIAAYGEAAVENDTYTYEKGDMELVFEIKEEKVCNIMYYSKAGK